MTFFVEICGPWQWRPGRFRSDRMTRCWWGFVAVGWMREDMAAYHNRAASGQTEWIERSRGW
jgi:hypothetical protein